MSKTCCVTGCSSGYRSNKEKASLFCFPSSAELREKWKRAVPRLEAGGFSFESKNVRVCEKHFDASDVVRTDEHIVNGVVVSLQRERPRLRTNAVPRIFDGLPAYLTKPKPRSRPATQRQPAKRRRELSPEYAAVECQNVNTDSAGEASDDAAASDSGHADQACQMEQAVCSFLEVQALKAQLSSTRQRLERCQKQLAKMRVLANKNARLLQNLDMLSTREKLIYDQCIMKANAKSPKAARYEKAWIYDSLLLKIKSTVVYTFLHENEYLPLPNPRTLYTYLRSLKADYGFDSSLFTILKDKLQVLPERERRGVLMFDEMSLFSGSTASAMKFYSKQQGCQKLHNSAGTYNFTKQMNDLFDCLNSRRPQDVQYNEAEHIATLKVNIKWLEDCCTYIESLPKQRQVCFLSKPTCGALRITLHSTVALIDRLLKSGFRYVLVGNLGQDPLESKSFGRRGFSVSTGLDGAAGSPSLRLPRDTEYAVPTSKEEKKTYMNRVPTIFPLRPQKVERRRPLIRTQPELPNSPTVAPQHDPEVSGSAITSSSSDSEDTAQQSTLLMDHAYSSQESSYDQLAKKVACQNNIITELAEKAEAAYAHVEELNRQLKRSQQDHAEAKKLCDRLQQKNRCLRLELSCMQKKVKRCKAEATQKIDITYEALVEDEKKLRYYTGFTSRKSFDSFWSLLEPDAKKLRFWQMKETENEDRNFILPLKTQLVLVLMRLRLGLTALTLRTVE
ncbi:hypothetical protein MRX96_058883 [Rhipicephalus microplus]